MRNLNAWKNPTQYYIFNTRFLHKNSCQFNKQLQKKILDMHTLFKVILSHRKQTEKFTITIAKEGIYVEM